MQDIRVVTATEPRPHPELVKAIASALERIIRSRLATGEYVVVNGMIQKASQRE
jgi:hypothetical protein